MAKKLSFEEWLLTDTGKRCADDSLDTKNPYLTNRLYWAYTSGQSSWDIQYSTEFGELLRLLHGRKNLPKYIRNRIDYLLRNQIKCAE